MAGPLSAKEAKAFKSETPCEIHLSMYLAKYSAV